MKPQDLTFFAAVLVLHSASLCGAFAAENASPAPTHATLISEIRPGLVATITRHLDRLLLPNGTVRELKGKTAEGQEAFAFYSTYDLTGNQIYRQAGVALAGRVVRSMRATKFGVLPIKEKEKTGGEMIIGGGPPALGFYAARTGYVLQREGGRAADVRYLAEVIDRFPWNEQGWWASTIDVKTGESKEPMSKPSIINKTATMAMAAAILSDYVKNQAPELAARLRQKADKCIYDQILPAQEKDGFWHYSLTGNDPKDKDVFGYFMLTLNALMDVQQFCESYRTEKLNAAVQRAQGFALRCLAPMTEPHNGVAPRERATPGTPARYKMDDEVKRGFALARILLGAGAANEGVPILRAALRNFPVGNAGQDGAHAAEPAALILATLPRSDGVRPVHSAFEAIDLN